MLRATGVIIAPPKPCRIRLATSSVRDPDRPQQAEPSRKTAIAHWNTRRGPKRSATQPLSGMKTARLSR